MNLPAPALVLALLPLSAQALGAPQQEAKLLASDAEAEDTYGSSIATDGVRVLVGSPFEGDAPDLAGAAYVYRRSLGGTWVEEQKLVPASAGLGDKAGTSVALEGDLAVVGARHRPGPGGAQAGALFVWRRTGSTWALEATLQASDGSVADELGATLAISDGVIVVGAPLQDRSGIGIDAGAAYVFEQVSGVWQETAKLTPADTAQDDEFGRSVDIEGSTIAVGAWGDDDLGLSSGSAYVFERQAGTWVETQKLTARNGEASDQFGISIALSETELVVGSWGDEDQGGNAGSAYVFRRNAMGNFVQRQELYASDAAAVDLFGIRVAADGPRIVVGAVGARGAANDAGAAYVFERIGNAFVETALLAADDGADGDGFGTVALSRNLVLVGAHQNTDQGPNTGSAYVFRLRDYEGTGYCTSSINSSGAAAEIRAEGSVLLDDGDLELFVDSAPPGVPGLLYFGPNAVQLSFGNGFRCVGGQTTRVLPLLVMDGAGSGARRLNFTAPYAANLTAGTPARFQYWFRDPMAGGAEFNLSDGVEVTLQ